MLFNLMNLLKEEDVTRLEFKNELMLVKEIDRMEEGKLFIRYTYLPLRKQINIESTYRYTTTVEYVDVKGLFTEKKFDDIIKEHSHRFIRKVGIPRLTAGGNLSINPENAIF
jgi:hypothetical protein